MHKLLAILLALLMSIGLLAAAIYVPATSNWVMLPLMEHYAPPEDTGLPAEEYKPVVEMITRYLKGGDAPFQHVFTLDGTNYAAFNQKEQQHMADVQGLFGLCRRVGWTALALSALLAAALFLPRERRTLVWLRRTLLGVLAAVAIIALLAVIDFDGLFILFHRVAFTNDLWLLNPQTDLLIRLMPTKFFVAYAALIGAAWLSGMAVIIGGTLLFQRFLPKE